MERLTLTEANATDILEQVVGAQVAVALVALDYNWGPPISGRFDSDFCQLWAAARIDLGPQTMKLLANHNQYGSLQNWSDELTFEPVKDCKMHKLYFLHARYMFSEFVLKLETEAGHLHYDNNGGFGVNYRIVPCSGRGTTAVAGDGAIWNFTNIIPTTLLWRKHDR